MSKKKTRLGCHLITRGTKEVNAQADDDLSVPDPEQAVGKQLIKKIMEEDEENGDQPASS